MPLRGSARSADYRAGTDGRLEMVGVAFVVFLSFAITMMRRFQRLDLQQRQSRPATFIFYSFFIFGIGATLLQLYNVAALGVFWPFLTGIVFQVMGRGVPVCAHDSPAARIERQRFRFMSGMAAKITTLVRCHEVGRNQR